MRSKFSRTACALLAAAAAATASSAEGGASPGDRSPPALRAAPGYGRFDPYRLFPHAYLAEAAAAPRIPYPASYDVPDEEETRLRNSLEHENLGRVPIPANSDIVSFYGHPSSRRMGILGEYPKEKLASLLAGYARLFDEANGDRDVVPAFHLVYGTCWPEGEIGFIPASSVEEYASFAAEKGMLVFLDHQIGKYTVEDSVRRLLPFLRFPNVHLALDPEWRTLTPMREIGYITAGEINRAQELIQDYLREHGLPGVRMLVVHQFVEKMIRDRTGVRSDFDRVMPIHVMDGFGNPALKRSVYRLNARAGNLPLKGFKLFFKTPHPYAGYDEPLMTPREVMDLEPAPVLVMYQ